MQRAATVVPAMLLAVASAGWTQETEDRTRGLWSTEFRKARAAEVPAARRLAAPARVAAAPAAAVTAPAGAALLGVTVWLLKPSQAKDPAAVRAIVHEKGNRPHTPVRTSSQTQFFEGDHLRLTVESGRTGYLYVVSWERYQDGGIGPQTLIFPTTRLRNGDNRVRAGYPVELPAGTDDPSYFTMRRSRAGHVGEEVLFIVAPRPIPGVRIGDDPVTLSGETVETWRKRWHTQVESIELPATQDQPLTPEEVKLLRAGNAFQDTDPLPQTLYRINDPQPDRPMLVALQLSLRK